jgi:drug/metabolite transporter (DMT)-like permease
MTAIALALAASLAWGCSDFLAGVQSRREQVLGLLLASQAAGLAVVVPLAIASGEPLPSTGDMLWAGAAGIAELVGFACFYRAMAVGEIPLVAPISGAAALVPLAVDLVAGHQPGPIAEAGLVLAIAGVGLASWERGEGGASGAAARGAGLAVLAALAFGLFFVGMDSAADAGVWWPVVLNRCASIGMLVIVALVSRRPPRVARAARPTAAAIGILDIGANALFVAALGYGLAGIVSVLGSLYPLTTVVLAWLVLRERAGSWQRLGIVGALAGVALVSLGG